MMTRIEKAVLAGGCFWGMQDLLRRYAGVVSTRVGYAGGDVLNVTYRNHDTHPEANEITFFPDTISYRQILEFFSRFMTRLPVIARVTIPEAVIDLRFSIQMSNQSRLSKRPSLMLMPPDYDREKLSLKLSAAGPFWEAELEHQNYLERYPSGDTCHFFRPNWRLPGRTKAIKM